MARVATDPKTANVLYHDAAAASYDAKWAISFDAAAQTYVRERAELMLPRGRYQRALEIGSGTGFFLLNLWQTGFVEELHATDISPGMLEVCSANAELLGCSIETRAGDAEQLPYEEGEFDLVAGHAYLHHLPDPAASIREAYRVLRPGGTLFVAGEPTRWGDRLASVPKLAVRTAVRAASRLPGLRVRRQDPPPATEDERILRELEFDVDLHTFELAQVRAWAESAGFVDVRIETEELTASWFGWAVRTLEGELRPGLLGPRWARFAYRGWRALYAADKRLRGLVPARLFYNLLLVATKPPA